MLMILPTTLLLGALGYLFYTSKKELSLDHHDPIENQKMMICIKIWKIYLFKIIHFIIKKLCFLTKYIQNLKHN